MARGRPRKTDDLMLKSAEFLGWALGGIEREISQTRERLAALTAQATQLRKRVHGSKQADAPGAPMEAAVVTASAPAARGPRRRRRMSPEARKRISEMMKKRWAERKKAAK